MSIIKRGINLLRERGFWYTAKAALGMLRDALNAVFVHPFMQKSYVRALNEMKLQDRIFLWTQDFGWTAPLFQRPQHIDRCLAEKGNTVFYFTSRYYDPDVKNMKEIMPNLFLVDRNNQVFVNELKKFLDNLEGHQKYLQVYSTNMEASLEEIKEYERKGYHIFYEYIDDLAPEISGTKEIPKNIQDKFTYATQDDHIPMAVTADLLRKQIIEMRGEKNLAFSTNGVDVEHFRKISENFTYNEKFTAVLERKHKIVGYYGAMAKWFDYDLLKYAAEQLPDVEFVLIGKLYDESFTQSGVGKVSNIHFIGPVPYQQIPQYASNFDICTIPFQVNSITNATSPLKLFEYMALKKPVLTTAMLESSKYQSVNIAADAEDFVRKVSMLLEYTPERNPEYYELLKKEAEDNMWSKKADSILQMLQDYEAQDR